MKKFIAILSLIVLAACHDNIPPQAQYQQPVIVQQAPAQQPVVVQQDNSGTALVAGAALGAVAVMAVSDRDRGYHQQPAVQQTHVTQVVNKTVIVNNTNNKPTRPPVAPNPVTPNPTAPISPAPAAIKPSYAAAGTSNPIPTMSTAALTAPKSITMPTSTAALPNYKPANVIPVSYKTPAALSAPKPVSLTKPTSYSSSKPLMISYSPTKKK